MTWDMALAIFVSAAACYGLGWFACKYKQQALAPTHICKWCGELLYTPVCDHIDDCPDFRAMIHRAMSLALAEYEAEVEKGRVQ
jgi:hypothetical protein